MGKRKYESLKDEYPEIISLDQMYQICGVAKRTALYLIKNGIVPAVDTGKKTWRYKIVLDDVITYLRRKEQWGSMIPPGMVSSRYPGRAKAGKTASNRKCYADILAIGSEEELKDYFIYIYADYPDVLTPGEVAEMTGMSRNSVYALLRSGDLKALLDGTRYLVPKENLIEYVASWKFCESHYQSKDFIKVFGAFEIWIKRQRSIQ